MRPILLIARRDFTSLLKSPLFWSLAGFCSIIWSASFIRVMYAFIEQQATNGGNNLHMTVMLTHISWVNVILLFCAPIITMRLLAEEKKNHTFDLLLTCPVTSTEITFGKCIAGMLSVAVLVFISLIYPFTVAFMAQLELAPLFAAYAGLMLMAFIYVSVGIFSSSLTSSVLLSAVIALVINLSIFIVNGLGQSFQGTMLADIFTHLEVTSHFWQFLKGVVSTKSTVLLLSAISLFVFLTQRVVESTRWR